MGCVSKGFDNHIVAASVYKPTMLVGGVSTVSCVLEFLPLVSMDPTVTFRFEIVLLVMIISTVVIGVLINCS